MRIFKYLIAPITILSAQFLFAQEIYYKDLTGRWFFSGRHNDVKTPVSLQEFSDSNSKEYKGIAIVPKMRIESEGYYELTKFKNDFVLRISTKFGKNFNYYFKENYFIKKIDSSTLTIIDADTNKQGQIADTQKYDKLTQTYLKRENPTIDSIFGVKPYTPHYETDELLGYWYYVKNGIGNVIRFVNDKTLVSENGKTYSYFLIMAVNQQQIVIRPLDYGTHPMFVYSIDKILTEKFRLKYVFTKPKNDSLPICDTAITILKKWKNY
jgi:hypothetical protein